MKRYKEVMAYFGRKSHLERWITGVYDDSRQVTKDSIFLALGKANQFIDDAVIRGASIILSDQEITDLAKQALPFCLWFYDHPERQVSLIGVTGTNGKTTTAYFLAQLLKPSLLLSNVTSGKHIIYHPNTTPTAVSIAHSLCKAQLTKARYMIMEVSSIGIAQFRVEGLVFQCVILTGISVDHLDYHQNLAAYQQTKIDFINRQECAKIVYGDPEVLKKLEHPFYAIKEPIYKIDKKERIHYWITPEKQLKISNCGIWNLINLSLAYQAASIFIKSPRRLWRGIKRLKLPKGRYEIVHKRPEVIIDYAHTASAFAGLLADCAKRKKGRLIVVFGAGGERDKSKRYHYGEAARKWADIAVITNDNPRFENPLAIAQEISACDPTFFVVELDRRRAIDYALLTANAADTVLIIGKGHECVQIQNGIERYFSDHEEVAAWFTHR